MHVFSDPTSVPVTGTKVKLVRILCDSLSNTRIPGQVREMMSDLQNPNLDCDTNTLCGFRQVSTPSFCYLPMAKCLFVYYAVFLGRISYSAHSQNIVLSFLVQRVEINHLQK